MHAKFLVQNLEGKKRLGRSRCKWEHNIIMIWGLCVTRKTSSRLDDYIYCTLYIHKVTWSLTLREEHRLRVLRRIFGPKRDEVTGGWTKLHNEELHSLYSSPSI
jgi:hypothetical protein